MSKFKNNKSYDNNQNVSFNTSEWSDICDDSTLQELDKPFEYVKHSSGLREDTNYVGFDNNNGDYWIYPTNYPIRSYQFNITKIALFRNTLVVLPTGLGKTFIAAVIMYNIYRWYPRGKVIFMAPTRPLVSQQIKACFNIMGISSNDTAEMTGNKNKTIRKKLWHEKRVFFATPQVVQKDIHDKDTDFPFQLIKLIVVDEAHRAKGRYAYTDVVQTLVARNQYFRILALSATPGRHIEDVVEIVRNLCISHIEVRSENSIDVVSFTHKTNIKTVVVPLTDELKKIQNDLLEIIEPYFRNLTDNGVVSGTIDKITKGWLALEQKKFREISKNNRPSNYSALSTDFSICISLYHGLELLERHGLRVFLNSFDEISNSAEEKFYVATNRKLKTLLNNLRNYYGPNPFLVNDQSLINGHIIDLDDSNFGHPKFQLVKKYLKEHFEKNKDSKVIVFCEYRDTVLLIHRLLLQCQPLIRAQKFVGQGGTGSIRAVTQKQQLQIMKDFRNGVSNTLIATSVAEEGIDVGEVDLIICFDISSKNPTRFVQRIGRTGRKRNGSVIMMVTEGKEHSLIKEVLATKHKTNEKIATSMQIQHVLYKNSPRIVPPEFNPQCLELFFDINCQESNTQENILEKTKNKKSTKKTEPKNAKSKNENLKNIKKNCDVRKFFTKVKLDKEEEEIFSIPQNRNFDKEITDLSHELEEIKTEISKDVIETNFKDDVNCDPPNENMFKNVEGEAKTSRLINEMKSFSEKFSLKNFHTKLIKFESILLEHKSLPLEQKISATLEHINTESIKNFLNNMNKNQIKQKYHTKFQTIFNGLKKSNETFGNSIPSESDSDESLSLEEIIACKPKLEQLFKPTDSVVYEMNSADMINHRFYEDKSNYDFFFENESKYASQLTQFNKNNINNHSTPIRSSKKRDSNIKNYFKLDIKKTLEKRQNLSEKQNKLNTTFSNNISENKFENFDENIDKDLNNSFFDDDFDDYFIKNVDILSQSVKDVAENKENNFINEINLKTNNNINKNKIIKETVVMINKKIQNDADGLFDTLDCIEEVLNKTNSKNEKSKSTDNKSCDIFSLSKFSSDFSQEKDENKELPKSLIVKDLSPVREQHKSNIKAQENPNEISPSVLSNKSRFNKLKSIFSASTSGSNKKVFEMSNGNINSSVVQSLPKKAESNCPEFDNEELDDNSFDFNAIQPCLKKKNVKIITSSDTDEGDIFAKCPKSENKYLQPKMRKNKKIRRRRCLFLDDEAKVSGNESSNNEENDIKMSQYALDSIFVPDCTMLNEVTDDMRAKYLQSIRSPKKLNGAFKIPSPRKFANASDIYSQPIQIEDFATYKEDSFVVTDDECDIPSVEPTQICPLERAEAILKAKRKAKRRGYEYKANIAPVKRRRIVNMFENSSDDET